MLILKQPYNSKKAKAKPFIKWVGGKGQLISTFEGLLPKHFIQMEKVTYIEPFIGGGAMLFYMLQRFDNIKRAVINDVNPDLIKAYKTIGNPKKTPPNRTTIILITIVVFESDI